MTKESIPNQLDRARRTLSIIDNDSALRDRLALVGYDANTLATGRSLYEVALAARTALHAAHGDLLGATGVVEATRLRVNQDVSTLRQMARTLFAGNNEALETLGLRMGSRATPATTTSNTEDSSDAAPKRRRRSQSQAALFDQAHTMYNAVLSDQSLLTALAQVGYSAERLGIELAQVIALENANTFQYGQKSDAQTRTANQKAALKELNNWLTRLRGIARPALRDRPDLLNKLGV